MLIEIFAGFLILSLAIIIGSVAHFILQNEPDPKQVWQELANQNHLNFSSEQIAGNYRGYQLEITTTQKFYDHTIIKLSVAHQPHKPQNGVLPETALNQFTSSQLLHTLKGKIKATRQGQQLNYEQPGLEGDYQYLQFLLDFLCDLAEAYSVVLEYGGKALSPLQEVALNRNNSLSPIATQLLKDIAEDTTTRLKDHISELWCPSCLVNFDGHQVALPLRAVIHSKIYGCRHCKQSQEVFRGQVIAVLSDDMTEERLQVDEVLKVNWLVRRTLFDYRGIEIIKVSDEEVERFAMQAGNDTDKMRMAYYKDIPCTISPECKLSDNTMHILQHTFGAVEVK